MAGAEYVAGVSFMLFKGVSSFNGDRSGWQVQDVAGMRYMFLGPRALNGDLRGWQVENVTDMQMMFCGATSFDGDLSQWQVQNVAINMFSVFVGADALSDDLSGWQLQDEINLDMMLDGESPISIGRSRWRQRLVVDENSSRGW